MSMIEFNQVSKKFRRGEKFNSIRDAVPAFFNKMTGKKKDVDVLSESEFWAVRDVDFQIKKGDVVGIMGPNGAGKSTILKLLSRIIVPNRGNISINGKLSALIEVTAGFHPELTGRENVYLNGTILGMRKKEIDEKFNEIVEFSGVAEFIDTPVKRYSSGMYSRLGFSVAAHMDPDILLVDEVLAVGDSAFQSKCAEKMRSLLKSGVTIVLVSHQIALLQSLCKRLILLDKGRVLKDGPTDEVIPFYENIIYKQQEESFKHKLSKTKVRPVDDTILNITDVIIKDGANQSKAKFKSGESILIEVAYETFRQIEHPIFALEIIRADGVLCCYSDTRNAEQSPAQILGKGSFQTDLGKINLGAGIYMIKFSVWDKELLHPYAIRNQDVLRIELSGGERNSNAVFLPQISWKM